MGIERTPQTTLGLKLPYELAQRFMILTDSGIRIGKFDAYLDTYWSDPKAVYLGLTLEEGESVNIQWDVVDVLHYDLAKFFTPFDIDITPYWGLHCWQSYM